MCKYCKNLCNSDYVDSVCLDKIDVGKIMGREISMSMELNCYEDEENGDYEIMTTFDVYGFDLTTSIKIHYCPMCGRKLG